MPEQRVFHAPDVKLSHLGETLSQWFQSREFETQVLPRGDKAVTVQARMRRYHGRGHKPGFRVD